MRHKKQIIVLLIVAALIAALAGGCGSSGSSSSSSESSSSATSTSPSSGESPSSGKTEASSGFGQLGGAEDKVTKFGEEADATEREAASKVLEENLQARARGDWAVQCATLTAAAIAKVEENPSAKSAAEGCPAHLEAEAQPIAKTKSVRANTMAGPIAVLRIKGDKAFALYHGIKGIDYSMPMSKEGGEWKVESLITQQIP